MLNIAINTFKEIARNRLLYLIVFFAFVFIIFSLILGQFTIAESEKIIVDFGLAMIETFGIISVLFVGSQLLFKEIEWKTIFLILSKPITRSEFIMWKFLGFSAIIASIIFLQSLVYITMLFASSVEISTIILWALLFTFLKLQILLGIVFLFSTFMSHILTIVCWMMIYFISHSYSLILDIFWRMENVPALVSAKILHIFFPPLEAMNIKNFIWSTLSLEISYFLSNMLHGWLYIACLMTCTIIIFSRKMFEE